MVEAARVLADPLFAPNGGTKPQLGAKDRPLNNLQPQRSWVIGGGVLVLAIIAVPLWQEFSVPGDLGWDIFLGLFLAALAIGAFLLHRYFWRHPGEVGEARFDTRNDPGE